MLNKVMKDAGSLEFESSFNNVVDNRTRCWFSFPLRDFIDPLITLRGEYKKKMKQAANEEDYQTYNSLQNSIKLVINTLYGVFASLYFDVGNAVIANNITGRARCEIWKAGKALRFAQTITDGGLYRPENVREIQIPSYYKEKNSLSLTVLPIRNFSIVTAA